MGKTLIFVLFVILSMAACASFSDKGRMEEFDQTLQGYERALMRSDYAAATRYIDPSDQKSLPNSDRYKNIKIVDCKTTQVKVSEDKRKIEQEVEVQYFLRDRNILKTIQHHQVWQYRDKEKIWLLKSDLPLFNP